jgi:antitoxin HicB
MEKNLEYYLGLPYTRELIPEASGIWFVQIKELPNCMSQGNSPEEALRNINEAMAGWIEGELEDGETIPEPREEDEYSGKFNMRVPKWLHRRLAEEAAENEGMSMNTYISTLLAEAVGGSGTNANKFIAKSSFSNALEEICQAAGFENNERKDLEVVFSTWFRNRLEKFSEQIQAGDRSSALQNLYYVMEIIRTHSKANPIFLSMVDLLEKTRQSIEQSAENVTKKTSRKSIRLSEVINETNKRNVQKNRVSIFSNKDSVQEASPAVKEFIKTAQLGLKKERK